MNRWQAIIFDLDDTLYPEHDYVLSGFQAAAHWAEAQFGINSVIGFDYLQTLFRSGVRGDTFNQWLMHFGLLSHHNTPDNAQRLVAQLVEAYRIHEPTLCPFPEVTLYLPKLHQQYRLGLVSDGYLEVQQRKLAALGIAHYLGAVVFSDQWGRTAWKPSTTPFKAVLEQLNVTASEALYIADNPLKDFYGPRQLGMATIWLKHSSGDYTKQEPPSPDYAPDIILNTWAEFKRFLMETTPC
ncbi:MAG: HAD family hydrolase [Chloroflexi bacterium]|nr:HAD family hydrolase [Chloroflexota bacterium]